MTQIGTPGGTPERAAIFFSSPQEFRDWLEAHHDNQTELWMGLHKKHVLDRGLTWQDAVPEALCFGWIDSVSQRIDDDSRRQRWTPRKPQSNWSAINIAHVERLLAEGRMHPAGIAAYERRTEARSRIYSYEADTSLDADSLQAVQANPAAWAFWQQATASYHRACAAWVTGAKRPDTRAKRLVQLIDDSAGGRLIPPARYGKSPAWLVRAAAAAAAIGDG